MDVKNKTKHGLAIKFIVAFTIMAVSITLAITLTGIYIYQGSMADRYNEVAMDIARTAQSFFSDEEIISYADVAARYQKGEASDEEIQNIINSDSYHERMAQLDQLRKGMQINDIILAYFDINELNVYDKAASEAGVIQPLHYIIDSYYDESQRAFLGESWKLVPDHIDKLIYAMNYGVSSDKHIIASGHYGFILTGVYPVVINDKVVACFLVEVPMTTIIDRIVEFISHVSIVAIIVSVLLLVIFSYAIYKFLISKILLISEEAGNFVKNNNKISDKLVAVKTKDELQSLSESILSMEIGINEYIENITKITAEKEKIGAELSVAQRIQEGVLPRIFPPFPERREFDIYAHMDPAKEVGGDFYDFFLIDEDHLGIVMADVSGKGVPAALFMMISKTLIKNQCQFTQSPKEILELVNNQLVQNNEAEMFVTVWLGILEISTGHIKYANAGHEFPALQRNGGYFELIKERHGFVLGGMEDIKYKEYELDLESGDCLFLYTDGVPEATDNDNELFGTDRMIDALNIQPTAEPDVLLYNVRQDVDRFVNDAPQFDDITMLGIRYYGC